MSRPPHGVPSLIGPGGFGGPQFVPFPVYPIFAPVGPPVPHQSSPFAFDVTAVDSQASSDHAARVSEIHRSAVRRTQTAPSPPRISLSLSLSCSLCLSLVCLYLSLFF
jgi:hypothetical protein